MAFLLQKVVAISLLWEHVSANVASPMTKVVELLDDIKKKLEDDAEAESKLFNKYTLWCDREEQDSLLTIKKAKSEIADLQATLQSEDAFRQKTATEIEKVAAEIAGNEKDLQDAQKVRDHEHAAYLKVEQTLVQSIDSLERAIDVMNKKMMALPQTNSASVAHVASMLRRLTEHSPDLVLNAGQQSALDHFFQNAMVGHNQNMQPDVNFLQVHSQNDGSSKQPSYGKYQSKAGGVTETLQTILGKAKAEKDEQMKKERQAQFNFELFALPLKREIEDGSKAMAQKKSQMAKSEQVSAAKTAELAAATELLQVTTKHVEDVKAECQQKYVDWHSRTAKRSDEIIAVQMALQILTSDKAKALRKKQSVGSDVYLQLSFIQTKQTTHRALAQLRGSGFPSLALLASRARNTLMGASSTNADPFADVKKMVKEMIVKLMNEMAEEAEHKEWCDAEMSKSAKSKANKEKDISKLESRIEQLEAALAELEDQLQTLKKDVAEAAAAKAEATKIRGEEMKTNLANIKEYQDAQTLLTNAMTVLKEFYEKDSFAQTDSMAPPPATWDGGGDLQASSGGSGVIGILEIAVDDFAHLESETTAAENTAAHEYKKFMQETEVQEAVWAKDTEYKNTAKIRVQGELQRAKSDLEGYQKELAAVNQYIEKLKPSCTTETDSYEERKKRRDAELKSLQEALAILSGNAIP
jgi:chromosome segregation ATPase